MIRYVNSIMMSQEIRESADKGVKEGFLIDADYITVRDASGKKKAVIRLWCKDITGRDFVVFDGNFEPYFYVFPRHLFNNAGNTATTKDCLLYTSPSPRDRG